jgi:type II secretion system protein G
MKKSKGFTLIELLVVIAIISLISAIVLSSLNTARLKSRDAVRKSDLKQLATAISSYYSQNGYLPRNQSGWCTYISNPTYTVGFQNDLIPTYISKLPLDPKLANGVGDYFYHNMTNNTGNFRVCAMLESSTGNSYNYTSCAGGTVYNYCLTLF